MKKLSGSLHRSTGDELDVVSKGEEEPLFIPGSSRRRGQIEEGGDQEDEDSAGVEIASSMAFKSPSAPDISMKVRWAFQVFLSPWWFGRVARPAVGGVVATLGGYLACEEGWDASRRLVPKPGSHMRLLGGMDDRVAPHAGGTYMGSVAAVLGALGWRLFIVMRGGICDGILEYWCAEIFGLWVVVGEGWTHKFIYATGARLRMFVARARRGSCRRDQMSCRVK